MREIRGVLPPLVTPFKDDKVAINKFHKNLEQLRKFDIGGIVVLGSTGEAPLLHEIEKVQLVKAARLVTPDDQTLIVGAGLETVNATIRTSKLAQEYGADVLLIITPHYYRSNMTSEALEAFYTAVADRCRLPILIYNIPQVTGVNISVDTVERLAKHERIIGIKDSSGNMSYMLDLCATLPEDFTIIVGSAGIFVPSLLAGAQGGILGIANVLPEPAMKMYQLVRDGKNDEAMELQKALLPAIRLIMGELGIPGIKLGMNMRGAFGGEPRLPLLPCDDNDRELINALLKDLAKQKIIPSAKIGA